MSEREASVDRAWLKRLTEAPSVGTACGPVLAVLEERFGAGWRMTLAQDGFCLFTRADAEPEALEVVMVAHVDEIGGCVYGARADGGFETRCWGNAPAVFAGAELQAFDWLAGADPDAGPVRAHVVTEGEDERLALTGERIRPYRTAWTFREETTFDDGFVEGKALDPRATVYAVAEAVRGAGDGRVGALFVMAEECAMDLARKAAAYLQARCPRLRLVANADVPAVRNLGEARLDMPAIRVFEGRNFVDPSFGIQTAERLGELGGVLHLSAARSGSQTYWFTPLASTLSVALPAEGVHLPRGRASLLGIARCADLLTLAARATLDGRLVVPAGSAGRLWAGLGATVRTVVP